MSRFIIEEPFWLLFPDARIGVALVKGIDNTEAGTGAIRSEILKFLEESNREAVKFLRCETFAENPVIAVWREAYRRFKTKKGVRCSIEALLKRVDKGNEVGAINPAVDLYNAISLKYGLPCGGEDLDRFQGDLRLTRTDGGDSFLALGDEAFDNTLAGEICYLDEEGAVCRCWNWRDGQRTMLTEDTKNAFLIIESVDPARAGDLQAALLELAQKAEAYLGGAATTKVLTRQDPQLEL